MFTTMLKFDEEGSSPHEILADRAGIHEKTLREIPMKISISQDHHE